MDMDGGSLPPTYQAAVESSFASIGQRPFDKFGVLRVGTPCCTGHNSNHGHVLCLACQYSLEALSKLIGRRSDGTKPSCHIALRHTFAELRLSARSGCHMCAIFEASSFDYLHAGKPSAFEVESEQEDKVWLGLSAWSDSGSVDRCLINLNLYGHTVRSVCYLIELVWSGESDSDSRSTPVLISSTGDEAALQLADDWLRDCYDSHRDCAQSSRPDPHVPRRLLEIDEFSVRIVLNQGYRYACLSHRWGDQKYVPKQLSEDISCAVFEIGLLPKTFQDAINVTKRLGLRHLWIDCFCIIQNSRQDWLEQSAVMADIYSNSEFTVAALASTNVTQGCFRSLSPLMLAPLRFDGLKIQVVRSESFYQFEVDGLKKGTSPLHERGWVVQERLTAPRTIFFGALGVYWECRTLQASQSHHQSHCDGHPGNRSYKLELIDLYNAKAVASNTSNLITFQDSWYRLLRNYTGCDLTYHSDKLIALSGISNAISRRTDKKLIQGLWEDHVTDDLLWRVTPKSWASDKKGSRSKQENPFPSWSWASTEGVIGHYILAGSIRWEVSIAYSHDHLVIHLNTWLREAVSDHNGGLFFKPDGAETVDGEDYSGWYLDEVGMDWSLGSEEMAWFADDEDDIPHDLCIALIQHRIGGTSSLESFNCLVLAAVDVPIYRRVGICQINCQSASENPFTGSQTNLSLV